MKSVKRIVRTMSEPGIKRMLTTRTPSRQRCESARHAPPHVLGAPTHDVEQIVKATTSRKRQHQPIPPAGEQGSRRSLQAPLHVIRTGPARVTRGDVDQPRSGFAAMMMT